MEEIAPRIYIETAYAGVTLAAINMQHGLILIDAPFKPEDTRAWRSALLNLGGGVDRLLINLDAHFDRTIGARAMDCTIVGHEKMAEGFRNRPASFKTQGMETGAEWEQHNGLGSIRWAPPEISFTDRLEINWDNDQVILEYHPGPEVGAIWAILPGEHIAFIGDLVVPHQPPFLGHADLAAWHESLKILNGPEYQNFLLISGRDKIISQDDLRFEIRFIEKVQTKINALVKQKAPTEEVESLVPELLKDFDYFPLFDGQLFEQRLRWGLVEYYSKLFLPPPKVIEIEE